MGKKITGKKITTGDAPLIFANNLSRIVNKSWESGEFLKNCSPITENLLQWWFGSEECESRDINFHLGQKQAILNIIYCHEILKSKDLMDLYRTVEAESSEEFINDKMIDALSIDKYKSLKYCVKMATGTGKTFVMNAIFIWQLLNALKNKKTEVKYLKNFLLIAPNIIVYDRLLDSFLGKENSDGVRDFESSDIKRFRDLFLPVEYREVVYSFIQNNTIKKEEIGKKITGNGVIAITNWHYLNDFEEQQLESEIIVNDLSDTKAIAENVLDSKYFLGDIIKYLSSLDSICVINDEAHHLHNSSKDQLVWDKIISTISSNKQDSFLQLDFSATPYDNINSNDEVKNYFPHIVVDFDLPMAIKNNLVKLVNIDKRVQTKSIEDADLNFKSEDGEISVGQQIMLKAGLERLKILEGEFSKLNKFPKMMVICEDTIITPKVEEFLIDGCSLKAEEILRIDSGRQGELKEQDWLSLKNKLSNVDKENNIKVIVSVLMLREGFDVNNICVIVPLRSSSSQILLEQTIGRGLRLMWRGNSEIEEIKRENIKKVLVDKQEPNGYYDMLFIVEHPKYLEFYQNLIEKGLVGEIGKNGEFNKPLGDLIEVGLKDNYKDYDICFPVIIKDEEEYIKFDNLTVDNFKSIEQKFNLNELKKIADSSTGETFMAENITSQTIFGRYKIDINLFHSKSYNDYIIKLINQITKNIDAYNNNNSKKREFPTMTINQTKLIEILDFYIRNKLFNEPFNPFENNNWKILMLIKSGITEHLIKELSNIIIEMQNNIEIDNCVVEMKWFSQLKKITVRENYVIDVAKCIYPKLGYPSNKGQFEKDFIEYCDNDTEVESFIKIKEKQLDFLKFNYIKSNGFIGRYFPDFIVKTSDFVFIVETKGNDRLTNQDTERKIKSANNYVEKINKLKEEYRDNRQWFYVLLDNKNFYIYKSNNSSVKEMLLYYKVKIAEELKLDL